MNSETSIRLSLAKLMYTIQSGVQDKITLIRYLHFLCLYREGPMEVFWARENFEFYRRLSLIMAPGL